MSRLVAQLIADPALVTMMGHNALLAVSDRSISSVVEGLLDWYMRGQENKRRTSVAIVLLRVIALIGITPITVLVLVVYDVLVGFYPSFPRHSLHYCRCLLFSV